MSRSRPWHGVAAPAPPSQYRRLACLTGLLLAAFGVMALQLVNLHVFQGPQRRSEVERILLRKEYFTPRRGEIRDRNGEVMARSELVKEVKANPSLVGPQHARFLAGYLAEPMGMELEELVSRLSDDTRLDASTNLAPRLYVRLKRGVSQAQWAQVRSNLATFDSRKAYPDLRADGGEVPQKEKQRLLRGFQTAIATEPFDEQIRIYPRGKLASHVLGYVGHNADAGPKSAYATTGMEGLELSMNAFLEGIGGWRTKRLIKRGGTRSFEQDQDRFAPRPGEHVVLTLDATLQGIVEGALATGWKTHRPVAVSAVVVDPRTGEILAMANLPDFDPNDLRDSTEEGRRNRAITDPVEPGSAAKVMTYGLALDAQVTRFDQWIDCHQGRYTFRKAWVQDVTPLGVVSVLTALAKSSNIAASQTAIQLREARLYDGFSRFGIGQKTGVTLPAESRGRLEHWTSWDTNGWALTRIAIGYQFMATPLQMTMAVAAVANEGRLMRPLIVKRIEDDQGQSWAPYAPEVRGQALSPGAARQMAQGLRAVVEPGGTGWRAALVNHTVAGKTGTADKWLEQEGRRGDLPFSSFIGFLPAEDPRLCIGVFVDEPRGQGLARGGGAVAAPLFREIAASAAEYLGIPASLPQVTRGQNLAQETGAGPLTRRRDQSRM